MLHRTIMLPEAYMFELYSKSDAQPAPPLGLEQALRFQVGAASPLWLIIGGAAGAGVAYWWASQWLRPMDFEMDLPQTSQTLLSAPVGGEAAPLAGAAFVAAAQTIGEAATEPLEATEPAIPPIEVSAAEPFAEPASFAPAQQVVEIPTEVALAPAANDGVEAPEPSVSGRRGKTPPVPPQA